MDRLVISDVKEVHLVFTKSQKTSTTFRLTNLMHTMSVAVSLATTNPSMFSFTTPFALLPPLATASFTLQLSKLSNHPPLSTPPDKLLVRSSMLPTGKASQEDLRRLFSKPGRHIFKDVTIPISFVGPHVIEFLLSSSIPKTLEIAFILSKAITFCDESQLSPLLRLAAMNGNRYVVSSLVDAGADVNNQDGDKRESVMSLAVKSGDIETVRVLTDSGYMMDPENDRCLHIAALSNRVDILEVLCTSYPDLDINSVDSEGRTALHIGASRNHIEVLRFLISLQGNTDIADHNGWTALHCASFEGHEESVEILLNSCIYTKNAVTKEGKTAFTLAVEKGHTHLYDMLHLGDVLHRAARKGDVDGMKICLSEGAKVDGKDQNGWTALHKAAFKGHIEGVKVLLSHGARVDLVDCMGYTPLDRAVEAGHARVVMLLIAHGAKADTKQLSVGLGLDLDSLKKCPPVGGRVLHKLERA